LEATRLSPPEKQKFILAKAIKQMPKSIKLWIEAAEKEPEKKS